MPLPLLIGAGLGVANAIGRWFSGNKQKKLANKINPVFNQYQASPYAGQRMGLAKQLFAGRMFGAPQLERNIFSNQANTLNNVNKVATDASQALAYGAAAQGQTDDSLTNLQTAEAQNKYQMLGNLNSAYDTMIGEGDKEYSSMLDKYQSDVAQKNALMQAGMNNKYGAVSDLASLGIQLSGLPGKKGVFGGFGARRRGIFTNPNGSRTVSGTVK